MASVPEQRLSIFDMMRLGLVNVAVGMSSILVLGVLNRVMVSEWKISATLVGIFVFVHYVVCPMRTLVGYTSDTRPIWGWNRTPYIVIGMAVKLVGVVLIYHGAQLLRTSPVLGTVACIVAFGLWGIGINTASVAYLALIAERAGERDKAKAVSIAWFMMIAFGIVATGIVISKVFSLNLSRQADVTQLTGPVLDTLLARLFYTVAALAMGLVIVGVVGIERRNGVVAGSKETPLGFRDAVTVVTGGVQSKLFFAFIFAGIFGINAQDVLLEPYGADVLGMPIDQTTKLQPAWGGATLISMLVAGLVFSRFLNWKSIATAGALLCAAGLAVVIGASFLGVSVLRGGVVILGLGNGLFAVGAFALMMEMTRPGQAGIYLGVWGIAQAFAQGIAGLTAGVGREVLATVTGSLRVGYQSVFLIEILALLTSVVLLWRLKGIGRRAAERRESVDRFADALSAG